MDSFLSEFIDRGYLYQSTNSPALEEILKKKQIAVYIGFDCTAKSLHIGSLLQIMILRLVQQYGHKPIIIIGDATTTVGDPTGRDEMRKVLSAEILLENLAGIKKSLSKFLNFDNKDNGAAMLNNSTWLNSINYLEFLQNYGKLISVNKMLSMDSVRVRLERQQALSFLEFNYMLLQAYDFNHLYQYHNCHLQIGGSDQWGNILSGIELIRKLHHVETFGLTTPLITNASGAKMGKSMGGAIWLNEDMTSPYDYYQYWRNIDDLDVIRFAKMFGEFQKEELIALEQTSNINEAKKILAHRLTMLCHGQEAADIAAETARKVFEEKALDENLPSHFVTKEELSKGIAASDLLCATGLVESKAAAKRLIKGDGCRINGQKLTDEQTIVTDSYLQNSAIKLSVGRKKHVLIKVNS